MKGKSLIIVILLSLFVASCSSKKKVIETTKQTKKTQGVSEKKLPSVNQKSHVKNLAKKASNLNKYTLQYIKKYAPLAVIKMHEYKIPASITLAQGILESGNGRSNLASKSNNHFGIKCHRGWTGQKVYHDDDEEQECFRKYSFVEHSYNDHSKFLTGRKRYAFLFNLRTTDYKGWARGLKKAGYATDKKYPQKLIRIIETYELNKFDKIKKRDLKQPQKRGSSTIEKQPKKRTVSKASSKVYTVKKGDTLYSIARKFNLSVSQLKEQNALKDNLISIGQQLKI